MRPAMRFAHAFALSALFLIPAARTAPAQDAAAAPPKPTDIVSTKTYVSLDPVPRGKEFEAAVVVKINSGFHMNSHKPSDSYLIPTTVTPQLPPGFTMAGEPTYPLGKNEKFPFSPDKPLNVYTGSVTFRMKLTADDKAALGAAKIPVTLRFQACNLSACLPPVKIPLDVELNVAAAGKTAKPVNPEIFSAKPTSYSRPKTRPSGGSSGL
jgi:thioredoxin:protein disulfide reductase